MHFSDKKKGGGEGGTSVQERTAHLLLEHKHASAPAKMMPKKMPKMVCLTSLSIMQNPLSLGSMKKVNSEKPNNLTHKTLQKKNAKVLETTKKNAVQNRAVAKKMSKGC